MPGEVIRHADEPIGDNWGDFRGFNHSNSPNAVLRGAAVLAIAPIARHEEILVDYGPEWDPTRED